MFLSVFWYCYFKSLPSLAKYDYTILEALKRNNYKYIPWFPASMALVYPDLSIAVTEAWDEIIKEVPRQFFMEEIKDVMGLAISSVPMPISYYKQGIPYGANNDNPQNPNERLERLSVFLFALGFPGKDGKYQGVLDGLESMATNRGDTFAFPPPEGKRISYGDIKAEHEKQKVSRANNNEEEVVSGIEERKNEKRIKEFHFYYPNYR